MNVRNTRLFGICVALASAMALADWDPGDGHVMTVPQLPDLSGTSWDVMVDADKRPMLADDWVAAATTWVTDAHLWYSWRGDDVGTVPDVQLWIYEDDGSTPGAPGRLAWEGTFDANELTTRQVATLDDGNPDSNTELSGWYNPWTGLSTEDDHRGIWQLNIDNLWGTVYPAEGASYAGYLEEQAGGVYWLAAAVGVSGGELGWHTSLDTYGVGDAGAMWLNGGTWTSLPVLGTGTFTNMAFVMTPEPGGFGLLLLAGGALACGRRRRPKAPERPC